MYFQVVFQAVFQSVFILLNLAPVLREDLFLYNSSLRPRHVQGRRLHLALSVVRPLLPDSAAALQVVDVRDLLEVDLQVHALAEEGRSVVLEAIV